MAQLVSSRLVVHSSRAAVPFPPVSSPTWARAGARAGARHSSSTSSSRAPAAQSHVGAWAEAGRRRPWSSLAGGPGPGFFSSSSSSSLSFARHEDESRQAASPPTDATRRIGLRAAGAPTRLAHAQAAASVKPASGGHDGVDGVSTSVGRWQGSETALASPAAARRIDKTRPLYAPASDDPSIIETDLAALSSASGSSTSSAAAAAFRPAYQRQGSLSSLLRTYQQLSKARLTFLVVLTAMAPYALCPASLVASGSGGAGGGLSTLLALSAGTALCSASANTLNQVLEVPYDAQMARTRARPLPRRAVSTLHAVGFALGCGVSGTALLALAVNPLTAALGLANIVLYAGVYTPLKRLSIVNTWVGAGVGALPPLMGWTACTNSLLNLPADAPGWVLALLLFAWQFPHFNSLAHSLRAEYARGGYRMMSVLDPGLNRRVSLRYALLCLPLCSLGLPLAGVGIDWGSVSSLGAAFEAATAAAASSTSSTATGGPVVEPIPYALLSAPINLLLIQASYTFWRRGTEQAARWCFWVSLVHLPAIMLLAMACKRDLWNGIGEAVGLGTVRVPRVSPSSPSPASVVSASGVQVGTASSGAAATTLQKTLHGEVDEATAERERLRRLDGDQRR